MTSQDPPRRRDAVRNRAALLAAARDLLQEHGTQVGHDQVARAAGVGVGTVYRHFPRKADLLRAVFRDHIDSVVELAERAEEHADPWQALTAFLTALMEQQAAHRGLADVLRGGGDAELVREANSRLTPLVVQLVERAKRAGAVSQDLVPGDIVLTEFMVTAVMDASASQDGELWRRALALVMTGMAHAGALPGPVPDPEVVGRLYLRSGAPVSRRPPGAEQVDERPPTPSASMRQA